VKKRKKILKRHERFDSIFGKFGPVTIKLEDETDKTNNTDLEKYDYFGGVDSDYYKGINTGIIHVHENQKTKENEYFLEMVEGEYRTIKKCGRGYSKTPSKCKKPKTASVGNYNLVDGMRKFEEIFDEKNPIHPNSRSQSKNLGPYDSKFYDTTSNFDPVVNELSQVPIIRNGQVINSFKLENCKASSARGSRKGQLKIWAHRLEIDYETCSYHNNSLDNIIGIQSNKNQLNVENIPKPLTRLIEYYKETRFKEIQKHFDELVAHHKPIEENKEDDTEDIEDIEEVEQPATNSEIITSVDSVSINQSTEDAEAVSQVVDSELTLVNNEVHTDISIIAENETEDGGVTNEELPIQNNDMEQVEPSSKIQYLELIANMNAVFESLDSEEKKLDMISKHSQVNFYFRG